MQEIYYQQKARFVCFILKQVSFYLNDLDGVRVIVVRLINGSKN